MSKVYDVVDYLVFENLRSRNLLCVMFGLLFAILTVSFLMIFIIGGIFTIGYLLYMNIYLGIITIFMGFSVMIWLNN